MLICVSLTIVDMELALSQHCQRSSRAQGVRVEHEGRVHAVQTRARRDSRGRRECVGQCGADPIFGQRSGECASIRGDSQRQVGPRVDDRHAQALQERRQQARGLVDRYGGRALAGRLQGSDARGAAVHVRADHALSDGLPASLRTGEG